MKMSPLCSRFEREDNFLHLFPFRCIIKMPKQKIPVTNTVVLLHMLKDNKVVRCIACYEISDLSGGKEVACVLNVLVFQNKRSAFKNKIKNPHLGTARKPLHI